MRASTPLTTRGVMISTVGLACLGALTLADGILGMIAAVVLVLSYALLSGRAVVALGKLRRRADESKYLALHDPVTDLPNRVLFHDRVQQALGAARRRERLVAVVLLDLNRFKEINDTLGHHAGDLLLFRVAERLLGEVRGADSAARLGGDEFAVLLTDIEDEAGAVLAAERIQAALAERVEIQGVTLEIEAAIGISVGPDHGGDPELLLQRADIAMYWAKRHHTGIEVYAESRDKYTRDRLSLVSELRQAIEDDELVVYFQPKAQVADGTVVGVEALVRWNHPRRGFLPPDEFIPLAESTGLIGPLTTHVLDASLRQWAAWRDDGLDLCLAVNLSTRNLLDLHLVDVVAELMDRYGVPAGALELEVTETMMMEDPTRSAEVLNLLAGLGTRIAIDDFGTGYTSLSWLKRLPVNTLKIDRSFVTGLGSGDDDTVIVRSTINLARDLGLDVIAEGVEDQCAWDTLADLGCQQVQGFLLSRPVPGDELARWFRARSAATPPGTNRRPAVPATARDQDQLVP